MSFKPNKDRIFYNVNFVWSLVFRILRIIFDTICSDRETILLEMVILAFAVSNNLWFPVFPKSPFPHLRTNQSRSFNIWIAIWNTFVVQQRILLQKNQEPREDRTKETMQGRSHSESTQVKIRKSATHSRGHDSFVRFSNFLYVSSHDY